MVTMNGEPRKPACVWQQGPMRIIATEDTTNDGTVFQMLNLEYKEHDSLGVDRWEPFPIMMNQIDGLDMVMAEIISKIDLVPDWVRSYVKGLRDDIIERDFICVHDHDQAED